MRGMPSGGQEGGAATIKTAQCAQRVLRCSLHGRTAGVAGAPPHHHDSFLSAAPSLLPAASLAASFASWCSFSCQWNSLDTSLRAAAVGTAVAGGGGEMKSQWVAGAGIRRPSPASGTAWTRPCGRLR